MLSRDSQLPEPAANSQPPRRPPAPAAPRLYAEPQARPRHAAPPQPAALSSAPDFPALLRALQRRWLLALGLGLLLAPAAAAAAWFLLSPKYTAFAQLHIAAYSPKVGTTNVDAVDSRSEFLTYQRTQAARIKSRLVLSAALARDDVKRLTLVQQQADPLAWLEEELKVEYQEGNEILTVLLAGTRPADLVTLVDAVTKSYQKQIVEAEHDRRAGRVRELEQLYTSTDKQLRADKDELRKLADRLETSDAQVLTQRQLGVLTDLAEMKKQHAQTRYELLNAQRRLQAHLALGKAAKNTAVPEATLVEALAADPEAKAHQLRLDRLKNMIRDYEPSVARDDPSLVRLRSQLADVEKALEERRAAARAELARRAREKAQAEYDAVLAQLQSDAESLAAQEKAMAGEVEALAERAKKIGTSSTELEMLRKKVEREEKYADKLWSDLSALKGELNSPPRVTLHQEAALQQKDMKRQLLATVGACVLVLGAVALAVAWLEFRLRRIRTAEEVASGLGIRVVGAVPELGRGAAAAAEQGVVESIDAIRTMLLHDASVEAVRVVMVTSAAAGEGKTTLACSLADSLARAGRKTLLIDCDLRTPGVHQLFELPLQPGFSEVLLSEIDAPDAVQATPLPGLSVMTAGQWDREVLQALAREGTAGIFEKFKEEFDFVIVDSHPVLAATDSLLLGQHVDAVLLSILRDVSRSPRVYSACQRLATLGIHMLGAVINGAQPDDVYANGAPRAAPAAC